MAKKAKQHAKARAALPRTAPRRSGRRGVGPVPLDEGKDFNESVKTEAAAEPQPELLETPETPRGKTKRLPGMEDAVIDELEDAAREYANVRDERMELTKSETVEKEKLLGLMKKHDKKIYRHEDIEIKVVPEGETVKVRILKEREQAAD